MTTEEALSFNAKWKMPSVLTYQTKEANNKIDATWKNNIDTSLLFADRYIPPRSSPPWLALILT